MLQDLDLPTLQQCPRHSKIIMLYRIRQQLANIPTTTYITPATGNTQHYNLPYARTNVYKSSINRLRTGVGRAKTTMRRWGYLDDAQSVDCDCGEPQTMAHLLSCRLLDEACTADDLATVTERAKACARKWENIV